MSTKFIKETAENAVRAGIVAYIGAWVASGSSYDALVDAANLKIGVVALAASVAMALGLKKVGPNKDSGSIL